MKQRLRLFAAAVAAAATLTTWAQQPKPFSETKTVNPLTQKEEVTAAKYIVPQQRLQRPAPATDSVTLTMTWELSKQEVTDKTLRAIHVIDIPASVCLYSAGANEIKKFTDNQMSIRLPKGKYALMMVFDGNYPDVADITKVDARDNVVLNNDTTISFTGANCSKKIELRPILPDGSVPALANGSNYTGANVESGNVQSLTCYRTATGKLIPLSYIMYGLYFNNSNIGTDRTHAGDVFVNPDAGTSFGQFVMGTLTQLDINTDKADTIKPAVIYSRYINLGTDKGTLTLEASEYKKVKFPKVKDSLLEPGSANPRPKVPCEMEVVTDHTAFSMLKFMYNMDVMANMDFDSPIKFMLRVNRLETSNTKLFSVSSGAGIYMPRAYVGADGETHFPIAENVGQVLNVIIYDENDNCAYSSNNHPIFAYRTGDQNVEYGTTAPFMSLTARTNAVSGQDFDTPMGFMIDPIWTGCYGETRDVDHFAMKFATTSDADTLYKDYQSFQFGISAWGQDIANKGKRVTLHFDNSNFAVDTIRGRSQSEIAITCGMLDVCPPSLQMLQMRDKDNKITNRFEHLADIQLNMSGGDFNYVRGTNHFAYAPATWKVEVAPWNSESWTEVNATEMPEYFRMPCHGALYRVSFAGKELKSKSGWFKLRVTLTDATGNYSKQTFGPAFYAEDAKSGVSMTGSANFGVTVDGDILSTTDGSEAAMAVYDTNGTLRLKVTGSTADLSELGTGVYIVTARNANGTATAKFMRR